MQEFSGTYEIQHHNHRLATWVASRAASASPECRFTVETGTNILQSCGFNAEFKLENLPEPNEEEIDKKHLEWRNLAINFVEEEKGKIEEKNKIRKKGEVVGLTHGVAAKLINCYIKVRFVCGGGHNEEKVKYFHPPIDSLLLQGLANKNVGSRAREWRKFHNERWSKFNSVIYQEVIDLIRETLPDREPLWKIEEYWKGHQ
jgi:hypothetical protein